MNTFQRKIINKALKNDYKLSAWEIDFIENLADRDDSYELSSKQNEVLNRISEKVY